MQPREPVLGIAKPGLPALKCATVAATEFIVDRQKGQSQPDGFSGGGDALGKFRDIVISLPAWCMVEIVKLRHGPIPCFGHLHEDLRCNGLDLIRRELLQKPVHQFAPGPETVARIWSARFGQARHCALKAVAVHVGRCRQNHIYLYIRIARLRFDSRDAPIRVDLDVNVSEPACLRKRLLCADTCHVYFSVDIYM